MGSLVWCVKTKYNPVRSTLKYSQNLFKNNKPPVKEHHLHRQLSLKPFNNNNGFTI